VTYNEIDAGCCAWLRELAKEGWIPDGQIDNRDIRDVRPEDCEATSHFFAGIGGWPYALRLAGWPDDRPVWTGSCPCQPFSCAGKRKGSADKRHLWPEFYRLIRECHPPVVFGEQVASADGRSWLAGVRADLEALGYAVGAADLCAAGVGAPHIRQRLYWMAHAGPAFREWRPNELRSAIAGQAKRDEEATDDKRGCTVGGLGDAGGTGLEGWPSQRRDYESELQTTQRTGRHAF